MGHGELVSLGPSESVLLVTAVVVAMLLLILWMAFGNSGDRPLRAEPPTAGDLEQQWGGGVGPTPGRIGAAIREEDLPPVLTRAYSGNPSQTEVLRSVDAAALATRGYFPSSQNYVAGRWSAVAWLAALLACVLLLGVFILAYMIAAKPAGTLTVIYERRLTTPAVTPIPASAPPSPVAVSPSSNIEARLATLEFLRSSGAISEDEFAARRSKILDEI